MRCMLQSRARYGLADNRVCRCKSRGRYSLSHILPVCRLLPVAARVEDNVSLLSTLVHKSAHVSLGSCRYAQQRVGMGPELVEEPGKIVTCEFPLEGLG